MSHHTTTHASEGPIGSPETTVFINQAILAVTEHVDKAQLPPLSGRMRSQLALKGRTKLRDAGWYESIPDESSLQAELTAYIRNEAVWMLFGPMIKGVAERVAGYHAPEVKKLLRAESVGSLCNESMYKCCKYMAEKPSRWSMTIEEMESIFFRTCSNVFRYAQQKQIRRNTCCDASTCGEDERRMLDQITTLAGNDARSQVEAIIKDGAMLDNKERRIRMARIENLLQGYMPDVQQLINRINGMVKARRNALKLEDSKAVADGWEPVDSAPSPCALVSRQEEWELFEADMASESPELQHVYVALRDEDGVIRRAMRSLDIPSDGSMDRRREDLEALARRKGWGCDDGQLVMRSKR